MMATNISKPVERAPKREEPNNSRRERYRRCRHHHLRISPFWGLVFVATFASSIVPSLWAAQLRRDEGKRTAPRVSEPPPCTGRQLYDCTILAPLESSPASSDDEWSAPDVALALEKMHAQSVVVTSTQAPDLLTRTTNALYRVLSGVFKHQESEQEDETSFGRRQTPAQNKSKPPKSTTTTTTPPNPSETPPPLGDSLASRGSERAFIAPTDSKASATLSAEPEAKEKQRNASIAASAQREAQISANQPSSIGRKSPHSKSFTPTANRSPAATSAEAAAPDSSSMVAAQPHVHMDSFHDVPTDWHDGLHTSSGTSAPNRIHTGAREPIEESPAALATRITTTTLPRVGPSSTRLPKPSEMRTVSGIGALEHRSDGGGQSDELREGPSGKSGSATRSSQSVISLTEFTYLNRTTRLAHAHDGQRPPSNNGGQEQVAPIGDGHSLDKEAAGGGETRPERLVAAAEEGGGDKATRADILLLCKLLHKHLEDGATIAPNGTLVSAPSALLNRPPASANRERPQEARGSSSTTRRPPPTGFFVDDPNELGESHESRLLESTFTLQTKPSEARNQAPQPGAASSLGDVHEEAALRFLSELFNAAARLSEADDEGNASLEAPTTSTQPSNRDQAYPIGLKLWSKSTHGGRAGARLKLVYWLLESVRYPSRGGEAGGATNSSAATTKTRFKLLSAQEAGHLVDQVEHLLVRKLLEDARGLRPQVLVAPYKGSSVSLGAGGGEEQQPSVIDDNLLDGNQSHSASGTTQKAPPIQAKAQQQQQPKSGLHLLADRLTSASFGDNFHLYLIIFIVLLFIIILCFAVPMVCCKVFSPSGSNSASHSPLAPRFSERRGGGGGRKTHATHSDTLEGEQDIGSISDRALEASKQSGLSALSLGEQPLARDHLKQASDAIWRKLSNSTTTLVTDRSRTLQSDGELEIPIVAESSERLVLPDHREAKWTSSGRAEVPMLPATRDKQSQTFVVTDRRRMTKSVRTYAAQEGADASARAGQPDEQVCVAYRDQMEARASDTLTKSELVMIKEKLVPIGLQQESRARDHMDQWTRDAAPATATRNYQQAATRHIDSSLESSNGVASGHLRSATGSLQCGAGDRKQAALIEVVEQQAQQEASCCSCCANGDNPNSCGCQIPSAASKRVAADAEQQLVGGARRTACDEQRRPTMRYLELPPRAQTKVDSIRGELNRLERVAAGGDANTGPISNKQVKSSDDQQAGTMGTYRRYDVI